MTRSATFTALAAALALGSPLRAGDEPNLGGEMKHLLVTLEDSTIAVAFEGDPLEEIQFFNYGETYDPPADVLNGKGYSGRYGWLAGGFIDLPPGTGIWVERIEATPGLETWEALTFDPILGHAGSPDRWRWSGAMTHNWYASLDHDRFRATYEVYVGDAETGEPDSGFAPATVTLRFESRPEDDTLVFTTPVPAEAGTSNRFEVWNATPGAEVFLVHGQRPGATPVPGCGGVFVDLAAPEVFAIATADASGDAIVDLVVPPAAGGRTIGLQAVERDTCRTSDVRIVTF